MEEFLDNLDELFSKIHFEAIAEGAKEALRVAWISVFPILLTSINLQTGEVAINWKVIAAVAVVSMLKWIDKTIHEVGKTTDNEFLTKGLTRF